MREQSKAPVRVRIAPSPTGALHVGTARTTLFNWLFARKQGGTLVLRIEDTDKERSEKKYEDDLIEGLVWLGLDWDEGPIPGSHEYKGEYGPYRQSERGELYEKYLKELLQKGDAYYCYCTREDLEAQRQSMLAQGRPPKYNGHCRNLKEPPAGKSPELIRFRVPEIKVEFKDMVRGKVVFDASLFGDIAIAKNLATPLYNFAVVVDDELMQISHVIRGEDHLSNTPKQILFQRALGFKEPAYAHIPLILNPDRSKMSKRFSDTALTQYREKGYLPEAMVNFLALLGWHPKGDAEVLSREALIAEFELSRVQQAGAIFNEEKLDWLNREHMKKLTSEALTALAKPFFAGAGDNADVDDAFLVRLVNVLRARAATLADFVNMGSFFFALPEYGPALLTWKESAKKDVVEHLKEVKSALEHLTEDDFKDRETLSRTVAGVIGTKNRGEILWPLRVALSGMQSSPDPIDIMTVILKKESLERLERAIKKILQ